MQSLFPTSAPHQPAPRAAVSPSERVLLSPPPPAGLPALAPAAHMILGLPLRYSSVVFLVHNYR